MDTKSFYQLATFAVSIPAGFALRGAMRAVEHNRNNPSPEKRKPPINSAVFGAVLGLTLQTFAWLTIHGIRTDKVAEYEQNTSYGKTKVTHVYRSDLPPQSELEAILCFTTFRGIQNIVQSSYTVPKTDVYFSAPHKNETVELTQTYNGFIPPKGVIFSNPTISTPSSKDDSTKLVKSTEAQTLIMVANYALTN